ncbi:MAG: dihydroorotase [Candidatus Dadabacteria bacterium]|nr:MAG: dihydroorotase [Candidatus Dadabacteria bacterium]
MMLLIKGGTAVDPEGKYRGEVDILISDGRIEDIAPAGKIPEPEGGDVLSGAGKLVFPGLVDIHVHLREPGYEWKETILTGCKSAVMGGYTAICSMPNTDPVNDNESVTRYILERASSVGLCRVLPIGAVTVGLKGEELAPLSELRKAGCVAFSDDGEPVWSSAMMRRALEWCSMEGAVICCHEEDKLLTRGGSMNESPLSIKMGLKGMPSVAEDVMVARDIELARYLKGKIHICHVSTARSVELIRRAKNDGIAVTCEVTPHHIFLDERRVCGYDTNAKMSPPLRTQEDLNAIVEGLKDGTIDAIASDHAPHEADSKLLEFSSASFGIIGLQTNLALGLRLVERGIITMERLAFLLSLGGASALGIEGGKLERGERADITLIDPDLEWSFDDTENLSKSSNSPFIGETFKGAAADVISGGRVVMKGRKFTEEIFSEKEDCL